MRRRRITPPNPKDIRKDIKKCAIEFRALIKSQSKERLPSFKNLIGKIPQPQKSARSLRFAIIYGLWETFGYEVKRKHIIAIFKISHAGIFKIVNLHEERMSSEKYPHYQKYYGIFKERFPSRADILKAFVFNKGTIPAINSLAA